MSATVILLQETSLHPNQQEPNKLFHLPNKEVHFNSIGKGKGIATYFPPNQFSINGDATHENYQITSIKTNNLTITNIYRSKTASTGFINALTPFINNGSNHVIMGDWNFCQRDDITHPVRQFLQKHNFEPAITPAQPTHIKGRCLDQIYIRHASINTVSSCIKTCYYSDHEPISITLKFDHQFR